MADAKHLEGVQVWTENRVKALLRQHGVKTPPGIVLRPGEVLSEDGIEYPAVVKVCSSIILHKTEVGGVVLGLRDWAELSQAVDSMRQRFPEDELLVERVEEKGVEVIVGALREPGFGTAIMFGLGGTMAELYKDVTFRLVPISRGDAWSMLEDIRGRALLEGFRGTRVNREALVDTLLTISRLADSWGDALVQMDLNPVFARENDAVVVDAKLLLRG